MSSKVFVIASLLFIATHLSSVSSTISRSSKVNSTHNSGEIKGRDERQWPGYGYYGIGSFGGPLEAIAIGLLVVLGLAIFGLPLLVLLFSTLFTGTGFGGLNLIPTTTTTVAKKKKRETNLFSSNPLLYSKLFDVLKIFSSSTENSSKLFRKFAQEIIKN